RGANPEDRGTLRPASNTSTIWPIACAAEPRQTMPMIAPFLSGFLLGLSLIVAIGAQNAFILRQGLLRRHVFVLCTICALSDALLIVAGVAGLGTLVAQSPMLIRVVTIGGALFLFAYAAIAFRRALNPKAMYAAKTGEGSLRAAI